MGAIFILSLMWLTHFASIKILSFVKYFEVPLVPEKNHIFKILMEWGLCPRHWSNAWGMKNMYFHQSCRAFSSFRPRGFVPRIFPGLSCLVMPVLSLLSIVNNVIMVLKERQKKKWKDFPGRNYPFESIVWLPTPKDTCESCWLFLKLECVCASVRER